MQEVKECPIHLNEKNLRMIALFSAGLLAGENYGLNLYAVPLLKEMRDPEQRREQFTKMYARGKKVAMCSSVILTGALAALYCKTKDKGLLCPISLSLLKLPITFLFMKKQYNDELMNYEGDDIDKVDELTDGWRYWHWMRVSTDMMAFVAVICTVLYKKG